MQIKVTDQVINGAMDMRDGNINPISLAIYTQKDGVVKVKTFKYYLTVWYSDGCQTDYHFDAKALTMMSQWDNEQVVVPAVINLTSEENMEVLNILDDVNCKVHESFMTMSMEHGRLVYEVDMYDVEHDNILDAMKDALESIKKVQNEIDKQKPL